MRTQYVGQGDFAVSADPEVVLQATLGSCVATCIFDHFVGVGGLNHMVLPAKYSRISLLDARDQVNDMERLINAALKLGARRHHLKAKVFGGAQVTKIGSDIGETNLRFVFEFLASEGIACGAKSVGGHRARRLRVWPTTGRVQQKFVSDISVAPVASPQRPAQAGPLGVELF